MNDVFVVGRLPRVTYNPRNDLRLEEQLQDYLEDRGTILSVSGPTKTGKTTLLRSVAPKAIWLSGGVIGSAADFWDQVGDALGLTSEVTDTTGDEESEQQNFQGGASLAVVSGQYTSISGQKATRSQQTKRVRVTQAQAREVLRGSSEVVVIDDFHYIEPTTQLGIVRALKDLVFDGLGVIFASVPHRAYDAVRVEKEMTGRVTHLVIEPWEKDELREIAERGFKALNVKDVDGELARRLAVESFGSPHLMQEFCRRLCKLNTIKITQRKSAPLQPPPSWTEFFQVTAVDTSKMAFDILARGPRQRTDRIPRILRNGKQVDIYVAILTAIAATGPALSIGYERLRSALREVLSSDVPQRHEVTRVLDQMTQIAKTRIEGEPVVDYDEELSTLHISDPYFAFYLRWGPNSSTLIDRS